MTRAKKLWPHVSPDVEDILEQPVTASSSEQRNERRRHKRHEASQHVAISSRRGRLIGDLLDLSIEGAKLKIVDGTVPNEGDPISVTLIDGTIMTGFVSWLSATNIGLTFRDPVHNVEDKLTFENLGRTFFSSALQLQRRTQKR